MSQSFSYKIKRQFLILLGNMPDMLELPLLEVNKLSNLPANIISMQYGADGK